MAAAGQALPGAFTKAVGTFVDETGELRRGDLVAFDALVGLVALDPARLECRRRAMAKTAQANRG